MKKERSDAYGCVSILENNIDLYFSHKEEDMNEHIVINKDRSVIVPDSEKKIGIQFDHNVNKITFDCPRYADDDKAIDMSKMQIFLNYMLPDKTTGCTILENVVVDETDPSIIHFDWTVTRNHTLVKGVLSTLICIKQTDAKGNALYHWNTNLFQSFTVGEGMENGEIIADELPDIIAYILKTLNTTSSEMKMKLTQPDTAKVGQIFAVKSINDDGTLVLEAVNLSSGGGAVDDVRVNGESIVGNDGVANVPLASDTQCGVVKIPTSPTQTNGGGIYLKNNVPIINTNMKYGVFYSDGYGSLRITDANTTDIDNKRNAADDYSVIVPHNLDYAVKAAMCDGKGEAWTADEQAAARERMGIGDYEIILSTKLTEESIPELVLGNDYKNLFIEISIPSTNTLSGSCTIMNQNNEQISYFPSGSLLVSNSAKFGISEIKFIANKCYSFTNVGSNNTAINVKNNSSLFPVSADVFSKVKFRTALPADAEITIYGAR